MRKQLLVFILAALVISACGSSSSTGGALRPSSPFTEADAKVFDDGADFIGDPDGLAGRWAEDWDSEMQTRVAQSDLITTATISTLSTDIDPQQRTTYRLNAKPENALKGKAPSDDLTLSVSEDALGFVGVDRDRQRILSEGFVLFAKWYEKPDGSIGTHWHLSIASQHVLSRVRTLLERDKPKRTIIERTTTTKN
jgi:hypothetical protein